MEDPERHRRRISRSNETHERRGWECRHLRVCRRNYSGHGLADCKNRRQTVASVIQDSLCGWSSGKLSRFGELMAGLVAPVSAGALLKGIEVPYQRGLHRFAIFTASCTLVLIVAGALVTSNDAGLSVPDWPTSFGSFYKMPNMVGGVRFEHGHRMVAEFVGLLTIILAVWIWLADKLRLVRLLGLAAVATVIAQGVLGGLTVLFFLPPLISSAHAAVAQTF